ncbi:ABC transporter substrate-binding protein [Streptomyces ipomoeae]|uniref:ABC transporter substrate-binding protein n=1 Tax=Streptomyces ipomoeae TaxID=103232 RepID=UPI001146F990|nr:ABC transporter substrate-binding protein [Streptomyces ipomoeae]MDX2938338.1 ABC transporter substrate-binding protein [Streptomyces ipomoeae]TQE24748.1 ABC transporter substrate-binding protein [Streptomyces ipomoeae]
MPPTSSARPLAKPFAPRRRTMLATALLTTLTTFAATACTGANGDDAETRNATRTTDKAIPVVNWALPNAPASLDYAKSYDNNSTGAVMSLVTEPLERVSSTGEFTPNLATSVTQPNATTIVYKLRSGVKFSSGAEMTAQDVAWSIEHFSAATAQTSAVGQQVDSVEVTGPMEVTVKLKAPVPTARAGIAITTLVEEAEYAKAHAKTLGNAGTAPVGTGPYKVASHTAEKITLVRNPEYTRAPRPSADKVVFSVIPDDTARQLALRSGDIDGGPITDRKSAAQWKAVPGATVYASPSLSQDFLAMDVTRAPFDDVHVRRAVAHSVDRAGIMKAAFGSYAQPMTGLVPAGELAGVAGSRQAAEDFLADLPQYGLSEDEARAELAKSAHPKGFSATIEYVKDYPWQELAALNIQQNMKPLGVKITPKPVTANEWYGKFFKHELTDITLPFGFGASYPDPAPLLGKLVGKANIGPQKINIANWTTPEVDRAQSVVTTAGSDTTRWNATRTILSAVADQVPYVPLFTEDEVYAVGRGLAFEGSGITSFDLSNGTWIFRLKSTT